MCVRVRRIARMWSGERRVESVLNDCLVSFKFYVSKCGCVLTGTKNIDSRDPGGGGMRTEGG